MCTVLVLPASASAATRTTAAVAITAALSLFSAHDGVYDIPDDKRRGGDNDENFPPTHCPLSVFVSELCATCCIIGCFLFHTAIATIAATMSAAKMNAVHQNEPMR